MGALTNEMLLEREREREIKKRKGGTDERARGVA